MKNLISSFKNYLLTVGLSKTTIKNYLSDLRFFLAWLILKSKSQGKNCSQNEDSIKNINPRILEAYKSFLSANNTPKSTINRHLATLRKFCQFCYNKGLLEHDPAQKLINLPIRTPRAKKIDDLVAKFTAYLKKQGASKNTIKNYAADIRNYLLETQR